ncbi:MAG: thiamine pyrophosphate-binding protein [Hyphomicrobiaceae bacterium]
MSAKTAYQALAESFVAEGVDTHFVLMGDGNMHFSTALDQLPGMESVHVRHEHCAVAAATAYAVASGKVGVASVTCGPGLTQVITALPAAVRAQVPLVVFSGEPPIHAKFYNQDIDQAPLVTATGAHYVRAHSLKRMLDYVREAFHLAQAERCPVVLGIPYDLQKEPLPTTAPYVSSSQLLADGGRAQPDPARVAEVIERIMRARHPIVIAGRGALRSGARSEITALADEMGALLATTLPVRGLFDAHPFSLGVAGGYSSDLTRAQFEQADLVIAFGASLSYYTKDGGNLFSNAATIQVDTAVNGLQHGMPAADLFVTSDAKAGAAAICDAIIAKRGAGTPPVATVRTDALAEEIRTSIADTAAFEIAPGQLDPRAAVQGIDTVIPKDWDVVSGSGHQSYFNAHMRGRQAEKFLAIREFGAIGNGLSYAIGVAAARRTGSNSRVVLIDGDGSILMHIQEFETIKRLGLRVLICVLNDGAYGAEIHKLRADGLDDRLAVFGQTPIHEIAQGFGLRGAKVTDVAQLPALFEAFDAQGEAEVWNIHVSDQVTAPTMRKTISRGHGVM